jgi:hypothetical protein
MKTKTFTLDAKAEPVIPQGDNQGLADQGRRVMYRWNSFTDQVSFFVAEKGMTYGGWVVGLIKE